MGFKSTLLSSRLLMIRTVTLDFVCPYSAGSVALKALPYQAFSGTLSFFIVYDQNILYRDYKSVNPIFSYLLPATREAIFLISAEVQFSSTFMFTTLPRISRVAVHMSWLYSGSPPL